MQDTTEENTHST